MLFLLYTFKAAEEATIRFLKPSGKLMDEQIFKVLSEVCIHQRSKDICL